MNDKASKSLNYHLKFVTNLCTRFILIEKFKKLYETSNDSSLPFDQFLKKNCMMREQKTNKWIIKRLF